MENRIVYSNLGANEGIRNIYIRSTDIEAKNWESLLLSFPDEALYFMTKGNAILIIDKSKHEKGKVEKIFCPTMRDFLRVLRREPTINGHLKYHLNKAVEAYKKNKIIKRKYDFFKNKLKTVNIEGETRHCEKEPSVWGIKDG